MNELGDVVGRLTIGSAPHGFFYSDRLGMVDIGVLAGENST